ncbi:MAG: hypothetical protein JNJ46_21655 [Myxococcales bacterium]|nr:hypothetical protein [Myxococcales bacterium]
MRVSLQGATENLRRLRVDGQVDVLTSSEPRRLPAIDPIESRFGAFEVALPADATGQLQLSVAGLRSGDCAIAEGKKTLSVDEALRDGMTISLEPRMAPDCSLKVQIEGLGAVKCRPANGSDDKQGAWLPCDHPFALGEAVDIAVQAEPGWVFLGWSGACTGRGACQATMAASETSITATFVPSRQCNADHVCWENPLPAGSTLRGAWSADDGEVWAVGDGGTVLRYRAGVWFPQASGTTQTLTAVWGTGASNVWVVGKCGLVLHWDGHGFSHAGPIADAGQNCERQTAWLSVWGSGSEGLWLSGAKGQLWHRDKWEVWRPIDMPAGAGQPALHSVRGVSAEEVFVAGTASTLLHCRGDIATVIPLTSLPKVSLYAVWPESGQQIWIAGAAGLLRRVSVQGDETSAGPTWVLDDLHALWGTPGGTLWAFGLQGTALRTTQQGWQKLQIVETQLAWLLGAAGRAEDDLWVVGLSGYRAHWNGAYFVRESAGDANLAYKAVRSSPSGDIWIAGEQTVLRRSGDELIRENLIGQPVHDLSPLSDRESFLVLPTGLWLHTANTLAPRLLCQSPSGQTMRAMDRFGQGSTMEAYVAGDSGTLIAASNLFGTSVLCDRRSLPDAQNFKSIWAMGQGDVLAVGDLGSLRRLKWPAGSPPQVTTFSLRDAAVAMPGLLDLRAIHGSHPDNIWLAGARGTLAWLQLNGDLAPLITVLRDPAILASATFHGVWARHEADAQGRITLREAWAAGAIERMDPETGLPMKEGILIRVRLPAGSESATVQSFATGTPVPLYSVQGISKDEVWISGLAGTVLRYLVPSGSAGL